MTKYTLRKPITYMPNTGKQRYVINKRTLDQIQNYQSRIVSGEVLPGNRLLTEINHFLSEGNSEYQPDKPLTQRDLEQIKKLGAAEFMQLIMNTRKPIVFAEIQQVGEGKQWNKDEYEILGNVCSVLRDVDVYDNGKYGSSDTGDSRYLANPPKINLLCIPGAILNPVHKIDRDKILKQVDDKDVIDETKFKEFYKERLKMVFQTANDQAKQNGKQAFITVPGIGNGAFAGEFRGTTIGLLNDSMKELLAENPQWKNIGCVWLDGFKSDICQDTQIGNTKLRVRNTGLAENGKHILESGQPFTDLGQMSKAEDFAETAEELTEFANCERFKIFAWDHFSYEGNDWVGGSRATDEANMAACNALGLMSGVPGEYRNADPDLEEPPRAYYPPAGYRTWEQFFETNTMKQSIADRLFVQNDDGNILKLESNSTFSLYRQLISDIDSASSESMDLQDQIAKQILTAAFYFTNTEDSHLNTTLKITIPRNTTPDDATAIKEQAYSLETYFIKKINESGIENKDGLIQQIKTCFTEVYRRANKLIDQDFLDIQSTYKFGEHGKQRTHASAVNAEGLNERFKGLSGDVLKRTILEDFKDQMADCETATELTELVKKLEKSPEYNTLKTPQGLFSMMTWRTTSSIEAFETLKRDATLKINALEEKSAHTNNEASVNAPTALKPLETSPSTLVTTQNPTTEARAKLNQERGQDDDEAHVHKPVM